MKRILLLGMGLAVTVGCQLPCCRHRQQGPPPGVVVPRGPVAVAPNCPPGGGFPAAPAPAFPGAAAPGPFPSVAPAPAANPNVFAPGAAQPFPTAPPGPAPSVPTAPPVPTLPPGAAPSGAAPLGAAPPGPAGKIESNWQPAEARTPVPIKDRVLLAPPEPVERDPMTKEPPLKDSDKKYYPAPSKENVPSVPKLPSATPLSASVSAAIPQFAMVKSKIAAGLRPADGEGFDWLRANGYRTVVQIRLSGQQDDAREQVEKRGLKYVALEVSPQSLTRESVDEFFRLVRDPEQQPLFVFDRDGALAGGLWYLYFRLSEELPDDAARIRARALGLREDRDGAHRDMWQAAQRYVNDAEAR